MRRYDYLIFDLDNTLLNFSRSEYFALQKIFVQYGVVFNEQTFDEYEVINRSLWRLLEEGKVNKDVVLAQRFDRFFAQHGVKVDGKVVDHKFRQLLESRNDIMDGAMELLENVKEKGYTIFAGTNGVGTTQRVRLKNAGMTQYFDELYISEEVGFEKPDVRFFHYIFNDAQIKDPSKVLMIGDSVTSDIEGANRAEIDSILVDFTKKNQDDKATFNVSFLDEIVELV